MVIQFNFMGLFCSFYFFKNLIILLKIAYSVHLFSILSFIEKSVKELTEIFEKGHL